MRKIGRFVFETAYGPFVAWCCTAFLLFAAYAISPPLGWFGIALADIMFVVQVIVAIVNIIAFGADGSIGEVMFKDHWGKYGDLWVKIPPGATSANGGIRASR